MLWDDVCATEAGTSNQRWPSIGGRASAGVTVESVVCKRFVSMGGTDVRNSVRRGGEREERRPCETTVVPGGEDSRALSVSCRVSSAPTPGLRRCGLATAGKERSCSTSQSWLRFSWLGEIAPRPCRLVRLSPRPPPEVHWRGASDNLDPRGPRAQGPGRPRAQHR